MNAIHTGNCSRGIGAKHPLKIALNERTIVMLACAEWAFPDVICGHADPMNFATDVELAAGAFATAPIVSICTGRRAACPRPANVTGPATKRTNPMSLLQVESGRQIQARSRADLSDRHPGAGALPMLQRQRDRAPVSIPPASSPAIAARRSACTTTRCGRRANRI